MRDLKLPIFAVGTSKDHIAPWRSVYKINLFADADVTFLVASGGHNVGIVSPIAAHPDAGYQVAARRHGEPYLDPDSWLQQAAHHSGSWWPEWQQWLAQHSTAQVAPPEMGAATAGYPALCDAPGEYVLQR